MGDEEKSTDLLSTTGVLENQTEEKRNLSIIKYGQKQTEICVC